MRRIIISLIAALLSLGSAAAIAEAYGKQYHEAYRTIRYTEVRDPDQPSPNGQRTSVIPSFYLGQPKRRSF